MVVCIRFIEFVDGERQILRNRSFINRLAPINPDQAALTARDHGFEQAVRQDG